MVFVEPILIYVFLSILIISISKYLGYFDKPNTNKRTVHVESTLNTGGLIIYLFFLITTFRYEFDHNIKLIIYLGSIISFIGFIDDRKNLSPKIKIITITATCIYLIFNDINITDLGEYEYIGKLYLGKFGFIFLILASGLLINAINYIDGIDGLLLIFFLSCLIYYSILINDNNLNFLIKILMLPVIINLILNLLPIKTNLKLFTGDVGSLFIGFFISFITIYLYKNHGIHPAFLIWALWYPVYDFLFVSTNRLIKRKSVFNADKSHLHHDLLLRYNNNHLVVLLIFIALNTLIIFLGYKISEISKFFSLIFFGFGFFVYFFLRKKINIEKIKL